MLQIYRIQPGRVEPEDTAAIGTDASDNYWLDLRDPTPAECSSVEQARGLVLPAINDVREIEATSRFFVDGDGLHLRIWFLDHADGKLSRKPVAFVLSPHGLLSMTWGLSAVSRSCGSSTAWDTMAPPPSRCCSGFPRHGVLLCRMTGDSLGQARGEKQMPIRGRLPSTDILVSCA